MSVGWDDYYGCPLFQFTEDELAEHNEQIRADTIDECIEKLAKSEDTILSDRQYYTLMQLKEQSNGITHKMV